MWHFIPADVIVHICTYLPYSVTMGRVKMLCKRLYWILSQDATARHVYNSRAWTLYKVPAWGSVAYSRTMLDDTAHGVQIGHYPDGSPAYQAMMCRGALDGTEISWYPNGAVSMWVEFARGRRHGRSMFFSSSGKPIHFEEFYMGERRAVAQWDQLLGKLMYARRTCPDGSYTDMNPAELVPLLRHAYSNT